MAKPDLKSKLSDAMSKRKEGVAAAKAVAPPAGKGTSTDVRSPTSTRTSTEVTSPTSTSTKAYTAGNFTSTVTGGAGAGATTVNIYPAKTGDSKPSEEAEDVTDTDDEPDDGGDHMASIAKDMMTAIESKDHAALAELLCEMMECKPSEEGE